MPRADWLGIRWAPGDDREFTRSRAPCPEASGWSQCCRYQLQSSHCAPRHPRCHNAERCARDRARGEWDSARSNVVIGLFPALVAALLASVRSVTNRTLVHVDGPRRKAARWERASRLGGGIEKVQVTFLAGNRPASRSEKSPPFPNRRMGHPENQMLRPGPPAASNRTQTIHPTNILTRAENPRCGRSAEDGSSRVPLPCGRTPRPFAVRVPRGPRSTPPTVRAGPTPTVGGCSRAALEEFVRMEAAHDLNHLRQIDHILDSRPGWGCCH